MEEFHFKLDICMTTETYRFPVRVEYFPQCSLPTVVCTLVLLANTLILQMSTVVGLTHMPFQFHSIPLTYTSHNK